ncbi:hypothetical protein CF386_06230 [Paraphotobacterium marinum]|uniref:Nudix hydrolase domain-containing protein n=1 Tax=Paraphotobacterium marinum TaxID=1755811 RepID=A0A220VDY5_9GAMM|nr:CoA pyrophosphatase [Paraphotobacterium marinum]ASK78628.1 hypothetical protein CF386_06230 [Paraphotobacterium marinum]
MKLSYIEQNLLSLIVLQKSQDNVNDQVIFNKEVHKSSVLIILNLVNKTIILTQRAKGLSRHKNEISFPGGRYDALDNSLIETATRETEEEIGLIIPRKQVISKLSKTYTLSGYEVYPYIAFLNTTPKFIINKSEVQNIVEIPFKIFLNFENYKKFSFLYKNKIKNTLAIKFKNYFIWGLTAVLLHDLSKRISSNSSE